ncbi:2-isopropylmalate synthase [Sorangium cellulosum]|uniref:2-isopropylmalate synthase n=1 Tax=Sorangium cellulosum TaxID=56 RepID=A0A4P2QCD7_SORCE|nr:2-isopropylmalate synthase [Sorangium cellulosum]AUX26988.1 2-isopropylmalate synthase [Sorangium cellulosum]
MALATAGIRPTDLIYDWNEVGRIGRLIPKDISFFDETLRDGLQNPSVADPTIESKLRLLHLMAKIGIQVADVGLPGSSQRAFEDVLRMCREVADNKLSLRVACAGRTVVSDITPMIEISQRAGIPVEIYAFIGSSPIRQLAEAWDVDLIAQRSAAAIDAGVKAGLPVAYVTEDTTRSRPEVLATLFKVAIDHGASRLCLCDTVGHATPDGVRNLINFTRAIVAGAGASVGIDWHGHNDRGLALENAIWALQFGADRVHGTALGIGERVGNAAMELILLNLKLLGLLDHQDLTHLLEYCTTAAQAVGWEVPINYPLVGRDAFRTATGVHAAAIIKAEAKGDSWMADRVYSGVPAGMFGRKQEICVGYMSGASNVNYWLRQRQIEPSKDLVDAILAKAKATDHILSEEEIQAVIEQHHGRPA